MVALTLWQPWATLLAAGLKQFETRGWSTSLRGQLLVHAGIVSTNDLRACASSEPFASALESFGGYDALPRGAIIGAVEIVECVRVEAVTIEITDRERAFGDYTPGRWAWQCKNARLFDEPVVAKGARQLWVVEQKAAEAVSKHL